MRTPRRLLIASAAGVGLLAVAGLVIAQGGWTLGQFNPLTGDVTRSMVVVNPATGAPYTSASPLPVSSSPTTVANPGADASQATAVQGVTGGKAVATTLSAALPAGSNLVGKVGIDNTTPGTTNGVVLNPSSAAGAAVSPTGTGAGATSLVAKASAGNLYWVNALNGQSQVVYLCALDAASVPSASATIAPKRVWAVPASTANNTVDVDLNTPLRFSTGVVFVLSTSATTFTAPATPGLISAGVQ